MPLITFRDRLAVSNAIAARARFLRGAASAARPADRTAIAGEATALEQLGRDLDCARHEEMPALLATAAQALDHELR